MKPHEETWRANGAHVYADDGKDTGYTRAVFYFSGNGASGPVDAARLGAAAPEMAQALLEIGGAIAAGTLDEEGAGEVVRRALAKAGVQLP